jgi:hypothetical protein
MRPTPESAFSGLGAWGFGLGAIPKLSHPAKRDSYNMIFRQSQGKTEIKAERYF